MNYQLHYDRLIERSKSRTVEGYTEKHHIIPRCMGGDDKDNIAVLTAEEHYVAHQLLVKIHPEQHKLVWGLACMTGGYTGQIRTNKIFGWTRRKIAEVSRNRIVSDETRRRQSVSLKAALNKPGFREKQSAILKEVLADPEIRKRMSDAQKGHTVSDETRRKLSLIFKGIKLSPERCQALSIAQKGRIVTQETRNKIAKSNTGKKSSQEAKDKIRESKKHLSEESRKNLSEARLKSWKDPVFIEKMKNRPKRVTSEATKEKLRIIAANRRLLNATAK